MVKSIVIFSFVILVASNIYAFMQNIDSGISLTYMDATLETNTQYLNQLQILANKSPIGMSAQNIIKVLPKDIHGLDPFFKEGCLYYSGVCLKLDSNNNIVSIGKNAI